MCFRVRLDQKQAKGERSEVADFVVGVDPRKNELLISGDVRDKRSPWSV